MQIDVIEFKDNPDGSATVTLDMDSEMTRFFVQKGFEAVMLEEAQRVIDNARTVSETT